MNISLPDSMRTFIDERLAGEGYGSASEYVRELIRADQKRREEQSLERLLLERLGAADSEFSIDDIRAELAGRLGKEK